MSSLSLRTVFALSVCGALKCYLDNDGAFDFAVTFEDLVDPGKRNNTVRDIFNVAGIEFNEKVVMTAFEKHSQARQFLSLF